MMRFVGIWRAMGLAWVAVTLPLEGQLRVLPLGDSITAGALGGPNSGEFGRAGYRYFLERYMEGSEGGATGFAFNGSVNQASSGGTIAAFAGQWFSGPRKLKNPLHSGYPGYSIGQIKTLVEAGTIPVESTDVILLQIGTNNVNYGSAIPATEAEVAGWRVEYEDLLDAILSKSASVKVVMAKIPPVTTGGNLGNIAANTARIEPFNQQVVAVLHATYAAAHPGRILLTDNYSPLEPLNANNDGSFSTATNAHDFFTGLGDGVHPYNAGHRKFAANFWRAIQMAKGAGDARLVTPLDDPNGDGVAGADVAILSNGTRRNGQGTGSGTDVFDQPFVVASSDPGNRAKFYVRLDLSSLPENWDEARFNLVFWGAPASSPGWGNCCDDPPATTTLRLHGIPDGNDDWTESGMTWANAPGNQIQGNGIEGIPLGDIVIPTGAKSGDVFGVASPALRDFINQQRGADGMVTFAVTAVDVDPGFLVSFQDSDFRDYAPPFLQLKTMPRLRILPLGDSITAGGMGGPNSGEYGRGGYRYFLERFLEGSEGGATGFQFTGSINAPDKTSWGTMASFAGQWIDAARPMNHPLHSGYPGQSIGEIEALVNDGTIPVAATDLILLQVGTNNVQYNQTEQATQSEISAWKTAYEDLIDAILAKSNGVKIAMAKIPPVSDGNTSSIAANAARIEPFNRQVVAAVYAAYAAAHPGRFLMVDNYSPLDPMNVDDDSTFATVTNANDFFTGLGDGVHPYNGGHRKFAANFWRAAQLAKGAGDARVITPFDDANGDGLAGGDISLSGNGGRRNGVGTGGGTEVFDQPHVRASDDPGKRSKFFLKLDLAGLPKNWDDARLNLVFWGAPGANPDWGNCCDDAPSATTLHLHGIPDGHDQWNEADITWTTAPGNQTGGNGVDGIFLGEIVVPAGARSGDILGLSSPALRDFINHHRGPDGMVTFAVTGAEADPGVWVAIQDGDFRDYAPPFLQLWKEAGQAPSAPLKVLVHTFDLDALPGPVATLTFSSEPGATYLVSGSTNLKHFDQVLMPGIAGEPGQTTVQVPLPPGRDRHFLRVERQ